MRRKLIAGVAVLCVAITMFTGCGDKKNPASNEAESRKLTYWMELPEALSSQVSTMGDTDFFKEIEKRLNIDIEFEHPPAGQSNEKFNLMVASRTYADIIEYSWSGLYPGGTSRAIGDNIILPINDIMNEYAPNFAAILKGNKQFDKNCKTDTGLYFGFPVLKNTTYRTFGGMMLRSDWLSKLNLPVPETISEWETTLRAFKEKMGATAAYTADSNMLKIDMGGIGFLGAHGVGSGMYLWDEKVKFGPLEEGYKQFLILMNKWYEEGLLDNEFVSNGSTALDSKMINGASGACHGFVGNTMGKYLTATKTQNPSYNLVAAQFPVLNKGDEPYFMERQPDVNAPQAVITTSCENPKIAAELLDYFYSNDGILLKNYGIEGVSYKFVDGVPQYTDLILNNPKGLSVFEAKAMYTRSTKPAPGAELSVEISDATVLSNYIYETQREAIKTWTKFSENRLRTLMPSDLEFTIDESDEITAIKFEVSNYVSEMALRFIQGSESFDKYDEFLSQIKSMNINRMIEIYQDVYNRYNSK